MVNLKFLSNSVGIKVYISGRPAQEREKAAAGTKESLKQTCSPVVFT